MAIFKEFNTEGFGENIGLYVIGERTSKTMCAGPIPAATDLVAVFGFIQWLKTHEAQSEIKTADKLYTLGRVGIMSKQGQIIDTTAFRIVTGDEAQSLYDDMLNRALEEDD